MFLLNKGVSNIIWFLIAFVIFLVLIGLAFLILKKGQSFGIEAIENVFNRFIKMS